MTSRRPRVMQSFRTPRPTTNPYIVMLDRSLAVEHDIEHTTFSWRPALFGRVDVMHFHWPEVMLEGDAGWKRLAKRTLFRALLVKLALTRAAIVRTAHNLELPDVDAATRRLLLALERRTDHRIILNPVTTSPWSSPMTLIPHGHYRDWFAEFPKASAVAGRIGYFGLIRRYKGVEHLVEAYAAAADEDAAISLRLGGRPSTPELEATIRRLVDAAPRTEATLRFLDDAELVDIATSSQIVVLPYRFMHNSGGALAALSLDRPVLVPRTEVNELLSAEVGAGWVHQFDGDITPERLREAVAATAETNGSPDLSRRDWADAGHQHVVVFTTALGHRRAR
ncbi:glycosyltransferase [Microbacterium sp.]|uniref:glycosyltransferase n=1 Tax=Microbacterium sp. TaxID=51671 RepID=UPI003F727D5C